MKKNVCPRCNSPKIKKVGESPVRGVFEVYLCEYCNFGWRSTENLEGLIRFDEKIIKGAMDLIY